MPDAEMSLELVARRRNPGAEYSGISGLKGVFFLVSADSDFRKSSG